MKGEGGIKIFLDGQEPPNLPSVHPSFFKEDIGKGRRTDRDGPGVLKARSQPQGVPEVRCRTPVLEATQSSLETKAEPVRRRFPGKEKWNQMIS